MKRGVRNLETLTPSTRKLKNVIRFCRPSTLNEWPLSFELQPEPGRGTQQKHPWVFFVVCSEPGQYPHIPNKSAGVPGPIFRWFFSSRTAPPAAEPRHDGRRGRLARDHRRKIDPGIPAGLVYMYILRGRICVPLPGFGAARGRENKCRKPCDCCKSGSTLDERLWLWHSRLVKGFSFCDTGGE